MEGDSATTEQAASDVSPRPTDAVSRVDLHCHSTASAVSRLGVQRALGLPECATPPEEVYELAKRRGMDFVTITDHDTIDGVARDRRPPRRVHLGGADRQLPRRAAGRARALLRDRRRRPRVAAGPRRRRRGVRRVPDEREIVSALAHPFYAVAAPLTPRHRRRLAELFPIWETRNGSRARELNMPAAIYVETHGGIAIGGTDDHAGIDIGRTFTRDAAGRHARRVPRARARRARARRGGEQGSAEKWAHAAMALAVRALGARRQRAQALDPRARARDGRAPAARGRPPRGASGGDLRPRTRARCCAPGCRGRTSTSSPRPTGRATCRTSASPTPTCYRRATRAHERRLREAVGDRRESTPPAAAEIDAGGAALAVFDGLHPRDPLRAGGRLHRARAREARRPREASARASRSSPTGSARCTASRARSRRSASAACRASRSR